MCQNNLFTVTLILKIIIHALKLVQKNFECFTSKLRTEHFEIYILKLIKKLISQKLMDKLQRLDKKYWQDCCHMTMVSSSC